MGVVEPPTPPTEVTGVKIALIAVIWFLGTVLTLRISMLTMKDRYQRRRVDHKVFLRPDWDSYVIGIVFMTIFWPGTLLALFGWKLAFPRGIKTRYEKEEKLQEELLKARREAREQEKQAREQEKRIKDLEKQVLQWVPGPYDRSGRS